MIKKKKEEEKWFRKLTQLGFREHE